MDYGWGWVLGVPGKRIEAAGGGAGGSNMGTGKRGNVGGINGTWPV
jgi:hypothetical protein